VPRAGPLRYWTFTILGLGIGLGSAAAFAWGLYNLVDTGTCASGGPYVSARECPDDTVWHMLAVIIAPLVGPTAALFLAFRGGPSRLYNKIANRREKRLADRIARGEAAMPTVGRPAPAQPVPSLTPLNRTWPPATWEPQPAATATAMPDKTPIERLQELDALKSKGLITATEFEAQRKRILGGI
jgi:hypothetical protein